MMTRLHAARSVRASLNAVGACVALLVAVAGAADRAQTGKTSDPAWQPLFDGKTFTNWQSTKFIGEGAVKVENGQIILEAGRDLTGITWTGPKLPTTDYEIALQAMRVEGRDFFAGVTFPVADSFCSLILGGWGGSVVGLSSINGMDASENQTSQSIDFESGRWYNIRIRVTPAKIEAWLDERQIINQDLKGNQITTRLEVDLSQPLGVASWRTKSALRDIRLRRL
jgi:3-keto-disaccharide hydrolase